MHCFVSNDKDYVNHLPGQKILNVAHRKSICNSIEGCYGPPCCFPMPSIAVCQDLRIEVGEEGWLGGTVCTTKEVWDTVYDALKDESESGEAGAYPRLLKDVFVMPQSLDDGSSNTLTRLTGTCSEEQILTLDALIKHNEAENSNKKRKLNDDEDDNFDDEDEDDLSV